MIVQPAEDFNEKLKFTQRREDIQACYTKMPIKMKNASWEIFLAFK